MTALGDRAVALNPSFARGWSISGTLRNWAGQPEIAIEHVEVSLRLSPRARTGTSLAAVLIVTVGGYLGWKWLDRQRYLRRLAMARIQPQELWSRMQAGESFTIVDLRHTPENEPAGATLPGALRFRPEELEEKHQEIPRDRDIVLYCT